jgi:sn-glycerol 3-phosphate transport system substrate-binding protein
MGRSTASVRSWATAILSALVVQASALGCTSPEQKTRAPEPPRGVELASCDVIPSDPTTDPGGRRDGPVEITLWYSEGAEPTRVLTGLVDQFVATHPGVAVDLEHIGGNGRDAVLQSWRTAAPDDRPSLAILPEEATRLLADSGQAVAPGRCLAEAAPGLLPAIEANWSVDGVVQAVPFAVSTPVLLYNRRAFREAGLDPDRPPATLDDLRTTARRLVEHGKVPTGLVFDTSASGAAGWLVEQWNVQAGVPSLAPDDGHRGLADRSVWHEGPAVDHLAWLQKMVTDGLAESVGGNLHGPDDLEALIGDAPRAAMTFHTSGAIELLTDVLELQRPAGFELGVAPLPGPGRGSLPGGAAVWMAAGRSPAETRAAWSLAAFLGSPAAQSTWAAATGYIPISRTASKMEPLRSAWAVRPQLRVGYDSLVRQGPSAGMSVGPEREIRQLWADALDAVVEGADPRDALRAAAAEADRLLRAYNHGL